MTSVLKYARPLVRPDTRRHTSKIAIRMLAKRARVTWNLIFRSLSAMSLLTVSNIGCSRVPSSAASLVDLLLQLGQQIQRLERRQPVQIQLAQLFQHRLRDGSKDRQLRP